MVMHRNRGFVGGAMRGSGFWCGYRLLGVLAVAWPLLTACNDFFRDDDETPSADSTTDTTDTADTGGDTGDSQTADTTPNTDPAAGEGIGGACDANAIVPECRFGLRCLDAVCRTVGDTPRGELCITTNECQDNDYCTVAGVCAAAGAGKVGVVCGEPGDCQHGLICEAAGFGGFCANAGAGDLGDACTGATECLAGLTCGAEGMCAVGSLIFGYTPWPGVQCDADPEPGPARVYFEIPRAGTTPNDFFRLPFPNDIRRDASGRLDLAGFPTPGPGLIGFDPVEGILAAAVSATDGSSLVPTVYFRFSERFDLGGVWAEGVNDPPPGEPTLYFLNITTASPGYNGNPSYGYALTDGGTRYICPRWLGVRPAWDTPLLPATTYAVILADGIKTPAGDVLVPDADMAAMLALAPPADTALASAWQAYEPLRTYLLQPDAKVAAGRVLAAAVFTTQDPQRVMRRMRDAVRNVGPPPNPTEVTLCDGINVSPCDDGLTGAGHARGCPETVSDDYHEVHMRLSLPMVQEGTRPYLNPADGGGLVLLNDTPSMQGTESVCISLTVPKNVPMPDAGWPVALYGHGTGGSFLSAVRDAGAPLSGTMAALGWDLPMHADRRGESTLDPGGLYFNLKNPIAARGNAYQGAADVFALVHRLETVRWSAAESPTGEELSLDTRLRGVAYIGHSQGSATGPLAVPFEPQIGLTVWSGAGAGLIQSLLAKTSPVNVPAALSVALGEFSSAGVSPINEMHPVLGLVQGMFDSVDPLNYARAQLVSPLDGMDPQHVLLVQGIGDSYTPGPTTVTYARLLRPDQSTPVVAPYGAGILQVSPPVTGNIVRGDTTVTGVAIQAEPDGYDGHFVMFRDVAVNTQYIQFLTTWVDNGVPTLVAP
ncbi:MAG: hypothetical protein ACI9MR_003693 [Myxococcota bacterium]|jgi:hypothetical protein